MIMSITDADRARGKIKALSARREACAYNDRTTRVALQRVIEALKFVEWSRMPPNSVLADVIALGQLLGAHEKAQLIRLLAPRNNSESPFRE